jgi:hypothetical protein
MRRAVLLLAGLAILSATSALASTRYDPRLSFRTISTPRFDIHYHQGEEAQARRLAAIAEETAQRLDATLGRPSGRVQVILVAQSDLSNGWATPFPFNTIEIVAAAPPGASAIGNTTDWLRMVFTHEYTHIVHLSRERGWIGGLRRAFGRNPVLFPNLYLPTWQIEGIATYEESVANVGGRVRDTSFRSILDVAAGTSRFEALDRVGGGLVDWPGGSAPYLYGAFFHAHLAAKYGEASLRQLTDATAGRIPYLGSPAFKRVFGQSLGALWQEYEAASRRTLRAMAPAVRRLTHQGFEVSGPRFGPDGRLYYAAANPHGFPALMAVDASSVSPIRIRNRFLGHSIGFAGAQMVFDQIEVENQVGLQSDLYLGDTSGHASRRLTHGARAAAPDMSPDGSTIVCTIQEVDRRTLALVRLAADGSISTPEVLVSEPGVHFGAPRWSPDGRMIAAERGSREIVLIDPATRTIARVITAANGARVVHPAWGRGGALLFASDSNGSGFQIYRLDLASGAAAVLEGTGPDARNPEMAPGGDRLAFVGYTADGYDLFSLDWAQAEWTPDPDGRIRLAGPAGPAKVEIQDPAPTRAAPSRAYTPWRTIAPRYWTPVILTDNEELFAGAATGSADALGRHAYAVQAAWTASRGRPDWQAAYVYDRWWPTVFANVSDDTDRFRDADIRTREVNAGVVLPFRRIRWSQFALAALHSSNDELLCSACTPTEITRRSLRTAWRVSAARGYGYSISLEDGWSASSGVEITREAWGSRGNGGAATFDVRGYVPVAPRHAVVAIRGAAASAWGDQSVRRVFSASGYDAQPGGFRFGSDAIGLLRGVSDDEIVGTHAAVLNADYRVPLMRLDRGWGTLPVFARVLHGAVFADAAQAWTTRFRAADTTVSVGAELSLDLVLGYRLPLTLTTGAAWVSQDRGFTAFGRIGRAF